MILRSGTTLLLCVLVSVAGASCGRESKLPTTASTPEARDGWARALATRAIGAQGF